MYKIPRGRARIRGTDMTWYFTKQLLILCSCSAGTCILIQDERAPVLYFSHRDSSPTPGAFYTYFYNHACRLRLEKLLYLELSRSYSGYFKVLLGPGGGFRSETAVMKGSNRAKPREFGRFFPARHRAKSKIVLGPCGFTACSGPPVVPSGPLGVSPDPPAVPSGPRGVSVCALRSPWCPSLSPHVSSGAWCLVGPTVV